MKQNIDFVGLELEGFWENGHNGIKEDGSLRFENHECDSCNEEQECYCYDDCECDGCILCAECSETRDNCHCLDCTFCRECDQQTDSCLCDRGIEHLSDCTNESCKNDNVCEECSEYCESVFLDHQETYISCQDTNYNCEHDCSCECSCSDQECDHVGEITKKCRINEAEAWIIENYPDQVNSSCGFHVHFSFLDGYRSIMKLCDEDFHEFLYDELTKWGYKNRINENSRFWKRLDGDSKFSQNHFAGIEQLDNISSDRYYHINFLSFGRHGTLEIRVGNMFDDKKITVKYFHALCDIINNFLNNHAKNKIDKEIKVKVNNIDCQIKIGVTKDGVRIYSKANLDMKKYKIDRVYTQGKNHKCYDLQNEFFQNKEFGNLIIKSDSRIIPNLSFLTLKDIHKGRSIHIKYSTYSYKTFELYANLIENYLIEGLKCV